jgi:hypothetical protein
VTRFGEISPSAFSLKIAQKCTLMISSKDPFGRYLDQIGRFFLAKRLVTLLATECHQTQQDYIFPIFLCVEMGAQQNHIELTYSSNFNSHTKKDRNINVNELPHFHI